MFRMRGPIRNRKPEKGFTLLAVLIAALLVTVGFVTLVGTFSTGLFASGNNESLLLGTHLAQEKMEEIRNRSYASIANETRAAVSGFSSFDREVVVSTPLTNLKQVSVNVYWYNKSAELSTSLVTYVSNI